MHYRPAIYYPALAGFLLAIGASLLIHIQVQAGEHLELLGRAVTTQYAIAAILMLLVWWSGPQSKQTKPFWWLIGVAVIARLLLVFTEPYTSNDVARYLFDGRVALAGLDPYQISHNAAELVALREQWSPPPEHAKYATLYPPLALGLFSLAATAGPEGAIWVWKIMTTTASLVVLWLGSLVLQRASALRHLPLLALSPLLVLESGEGMHLDIFSALAVVTAIYFWQSKKLFWVGACLALGALLKMLPLLLVMPMALLLRDWRSRFTLILSAVSIWFGGYLLTLALGYKPVGSIGIFFEKWRSGSPFFLWLEPHFSGPSMLALVVTLLLTGWLAIAAYLWITRPQHGSAGNSRDGYLWMQLVLALPLLLSPVIFPWYLLPLVVLMALRPNLFTLTWTITLPFLYEVLGKFTCCSIWEPADWPVHLVGFSLLCAVILAITHAWRAGPDARTTSFNLLTT